MVLCHPVEVIFTHLNKEIIDVIKVYTKYRKSKGKNSNQLGAVEKSFTEKISIWANLKDE